MTSRALRAGALSETFGHVTSPVSRHDAIDLCGQQSMCSDRMSSNQMYSLSLNVHFFTASEFLLSLSYSIRPISADRTATELQRALLAPITCIEIIRRNSNIKNAIL